MAACCLSIFLFSFIYIYIFQSLYPTVDRNLVYPEICKIPVKDYPCHFCLMMWDLTFSALSWVPDGCLISHKGIKKTKQPSDHVNQPINQPLNHAFSFFRTWFFHNHSQYANHSHIFLENTLPLS